MSTVKGLGIAEKPWELKTPPGTADYPRAQHPQ
jgi:hypothetical protein